MCWIDRDKFEKIINNLLSNAFKFTPIGGIIKINVSDSFSKEEKFAEIKISDSGVGIPKDKLDKIFNRFFQVDDSSERTYGGSGIGLALVKELIELHKWKIYVNSEFGEGTEFKIQIPMSENYLNEEEKVKNKIETVSAGPAIITNKDNQIYKTAEFEKINTEVINTNSRGIVLIVDDSEDVRKYLYSLLKTKYELLLAANGDEGIKVAGEIMPDLIISDVMMPSMDGIEFCRKIKNDWRTSDIPVILLTAKASFESKIEGLDIGADEYLTKPFNSQELFARIKNLLDQRKRLREKYNKDLEPINETTNLNSAENEFTNKAIILVEENLDKSNFGVEELAKELFVSRTQLHRKISTITGHAPGEFIRNIKLKKAAALLLEGKLSVTQVAYEIGFSSPAQFTRAFTKYFDCLPSEYSSKLKS